MLKRQTYELWQDKDALIWAYHEKDMSSREVANLFGCSKSAVLRWMDKHDIDSDPGPYRDGPWRDKETLQTEYVDKGKSMNELANEWNTSTAIIHNWAKRHKIDVRDNAPPKGEKHWNYKGNDAGPDPRECPRCGEMHVPADARSEYCSRECWHKDMQRRVRVECGICGDEFMVVEAREDTARYCSYKCLGDANRGSNSPRWNGGPAPYGEGWNEKKRQDVRERDGDKCTICGMGKQNHYERYGENLHVHHIVKARNFDDPERRNAMDNLVTMCNSCHKEYEGLPIDVRI